MSLLHWGQALENSAERKGQADTVSSWQPFTDYGPLTTGLQEQRKKAEGEQQAAKKGPRSTDNQKGKREGRNKKDSG